LSTNRKIAQDATKFLAGTIVSSIANVIRGLLIARILGPAMFGIWHIFTVINGRYNNQADLGLTNGMFKLIPIQRGVNNNQKAENIKNVTFWANVFIFCSINLILFLSTFVYHNFFFNLFYPYPKEGIFGLRLLVILNLLTQLYIFYTNILRANKKFGLESFSSSLIAIISLLLFIIFVKFFTNNLMAALLALILAYVIVNIFVIVKTNYKYPLFWDNKLFIEIFLAGFPLFLGNITYAFLISIDRIVLAKFFGPENLGLYAFGLNLTIIMALVPNALASTLFPHMLEKFSQSKDPASMSKMVFLPTKINTFIMFYICGFMSLLIPLLIKYLFPAYTSGIRSAVLLSMGIYFLSLNTVTSTYLISINKQYSIIFIQLLSISFSIIIYMYFVFANMGIDGIAIGTILTYFIYSFMVLYESLGCVYKKKKDVWLVIFDLHIPFILLISIFVLSKLLTNQFLSDLSYLNQTIVKMFAFIIFSIPFFISINKQTDMISLIKNHLLKRQPL